MTTNPDAIQTTAELSRLVPELADDQDAELFLCRDGGKVCVILRGTATGKTVRFVREEP